MHLTGLRNLEKKYIDKIFEYAKVFKKTIVEKKNIEKLAEERSVLNLFFENSTRTRTSFDLAEKKLGMNVVNFSSENSSMNKGESFLDTIKNVEALKFDYIVVRNSVPGTPDFLINHTSSRIINAGDGTNEHPTQSLIDIYTLKEEFDDIKNLRVCIVGNISHSRVALSNIFGLKKFGAKVSVCGPVSFIPRKIEALGVNVFTDINEALKNSDVINILRVQLERNVGNLLPSLSEFSNHYGINSERLKINSDIRILHPGPMNINVELDYETSVSENSFIFEQVTNGLAIKCAVFKLMDET